MEEKEGDLKTLIPCKVLSPAEMERIYPRKEQQDSEAEELKVTVPCTNHHICACLLEELEELRAESDRKTYPVYEGSLIYKDME